ncbi:MAG: glycosyltransferase family 39 protein, partial [Oscillospiraceae bacterium]|nr:glycosyltransferase family 39 protein [Oscillospiraceae bacterium]
TWLPAHFTAWGFGQMSVLLSYCMVPFLRLFGLSAVTARLPVLLASLAGMGAFYGIVRRQAGEGAALAGLAYLAIMPWHFMQSRWALDCNMFPHMFLLGFFLLLRGGKRPGAWYGAMVFFALCLYSYGVAFTMVPLFLALSGLLLLREGRIRWPRLLGCALVFGLLAFPVAGTMLLNALHGETVSLPFVTMQVFPDSVRSGDILFFSPHPLRQLGINARALVDVALLQKPDLPWNAIDGFGTLYHCSLPLVLLGLGLAVRCSLREKDEDRRLGYRLLLIYWFCSVLTGLCINSVNVNRINILFYCHALLIALALHRILTARRWTVWPLLVCYGLSAFLFFSSYFGPWAEQMSALFFEDFLQAVQYAGEQDCEAYGITPDVQGRNRDYVSEILTLYALQIDARYFQGVTDSDGARQIPYRECFRYRNPPPELAAADRSTAYVLRSEELPAYDPAYWEEIPFGEYTVLLSRGDGA